MYSGTSHTLTTPDTFIPDVLEGLRGYPKRLPSKYFYDAKGDLLFQQIMRCPEYYLSRSEHAILSSQSAAITAELKTRSPTFEVAELGPGDASKSIFLLRALAAVDALGSYVPIDISAHVIATLRGSMAREFPGIHVHGITGDYLTALSQSPRSPEITRLILLLGANIGNFTPEEAKHFLRRLRTLSMPGDALLIGIDVKKHPAIILSAYNDREGLTKAFNFNLLARINREAGAGFELDQFDHYPTYDPETGTCKSFLVALKDMKVPVAGEIIRLREGESILTEVSQKYSLRAIDHLARESGFEPVAQYFDEKKWFVDCLWKVPD